MRFILTFVLMAVCMFPMQSMAATSVVPEAIAANLMARFAQNAVNIAPNTPVVVSAGVQSGLVNNLNFGTLPPAAPVVMGATGIMLTNGSINGGNNNLALPGDVDVFNALSNHPGFNTTGTFDASSLQFNFTVAAGVTAVSFELVFASNEAIGALTPDAVVVMVDGVNYATLTNGLLLTNQTAGILVATPVTQVVTGFAAASPVQTVVAPLNPVLVTHTIKIAIADNVNGQLDSAVIVANLQAATSAIGGMGVGDFLPPVLTPPANVAVEATGLLTTVNIGTPLVTDNVDNPAPAATPAPIGPYPVGVTLVTWTATDVAGNVGTATQTVTVSDTVAPVITPPVARAFSAASPTLAVDIAAHLATVVATDLVGVVLPIASDAPVAGFPVGNTIVTFTVLDAAGNIGTATTLITITSASIINTVNANLLAARLTQFDANIIFTLPAVTAIANQTGLVETTNFGTLAAAPLTLPQTGIMLTTGNITGTGNNLGPLVGDADVFAALNAHPSFGTAGTVDAATLQFSFTVPANTPSVSFDLIYATNELLGGVALPDAVVVMVDGINRGTFNNGLLLANLNGAFLNATNGTLISGYTNLSQAQTLTALLNPLLATHTIKISIADNTSALTDSALIISNMRISTSNTNGMGLLGADFSPPVIAPAANIILEATGLTTAANLGVPTVTDNIDANPVATPAPVGPYPVGVNVVTWSSTDVAGNVGTAIQTVTITDTIAPVIVAPIAQSFSTVSLTLAADIAAHLATVTATDLVGVVLPITNDAPLAGFPVGNTTVTFTASDVAGNVATATTVVTVAAASIVNSINAAALATRLTQFDANINFILPTVTAIANQTGLVETTNFGTLAAAPLTLPQTGIMLTTGNITGTGNNLGPLAGDVDVFGALIAHPSFTATGTSDAASLSFSFTVPANTPSVSFDLIYATNELLAGTALPDAVVVMIDGVNRATFTNGLLLANLNGAFLSATNGTLVSGYVNLSQAQTLTGLLNPLLTIHTIKISIADNSASTVDSALIISNMRVSASNTNGVGPIGVDFLPPAITPAANVVVEATGLTTVVNLGVPTVTDNVDLNPTATAVPAGPYPVGVTVVTWTSTDLAGNIGTAIQTVTVNDTVAPAIVAPLAQTFSTASPTMAADIAVHLATVVATDVVGVVLPIANDAPLAGFPVGNTTVTYTVSDVAGNIGTATTVITVTAASIINVTNATSLATRLTQFDPNINFTLPLSTAVLNQTGLVETTNFGALGLAQLALPQTGIMLTTGNTSGTGNNLAQPGDADVFNALSAHPLFASTSTADAASLQFSFTVPANTPSVDFDLIYATNEALAGVPFPDAVSITIDGVNRATFTNGLLLSNLNGAFLTASNGALISGYTNLSQAQTLTALLNPILATHTIKISIADNSGSTVDSALILSNMRVSASNTNGIGVVGADFLPPVITPAANVVVEATGLTTVVNLGTPTVTDNVDLNPTATPLPIGPYPVGITLVTWTSTDVAGNVGTATQTVTVSDTIAPVVIAPVAQTYSTASLTLAANIAAHLATVVATDAVGVILPIINDAPLAGFPVGNTTVTFTVSDAAGNIGTATTVITVSAASILNVNNATSLATRLTQFDPNITFTLPVSDAAVNQTGLVETTNFGTLAAAPLILPQTGIILSTGNTSGTGNNLGPLAGDIDVFNALSAHPLFATIGTSDAASLSFSFTVPANTPSVNFDLIYATNEPLAGSALPDAVVVMVDGINRGTFSNGLLLANLNGAFLSATNGTLISGYTNLSQAQTLTALLNPLLATHTIKISIADNTTSLTDSALIISNMRVSASANNGMGLLGADFLAPVITPAANVVLEATGLTTIANLGVANVVDNIDPNPVLVAAPVGPYPVGVTLVTWTATDAAGNVGTATQTVTVNDTTAPVIVAPVARAFSTVSPTLAADIAAHLLTVAATDAVGVILPILNNAPLAGFPVGNTTVTYTVLDAAGNIGTATTVVTVSAASIINVNNATSLATRLTQFDPNVAFTLPVVTAVANQVGLVETTNFGTLALAPLTLPQTGIILTTGNTTGTGNGLAQPGDVDVFNALSAHPLFASIGTSDAASLQFSFTVPAGTPSVSFDLIYATNEAIAGTPFPDAVTVTVDGVNRATFSNGLLLSNLNGAFLSASNGALISGYTNLSQAQVLTTLLDPLLATHTIKITIADNSTSTIDSALIISNMRVSASANNGMGPLGADFLPPVITPAANVVIEATGPTTVVNLGVPNVIDNVDLNPTATALPVGPYPVGVTVVTWTSTDLAGNIGTATQIVTVTDTVAPVVLAPAAQTFSTVNPTLAANIATYLATVTATDVVGVVLPITNNAPLAGFPVGNTTVTFTVLDAAGNIGTATTVITVSSASILNVTNATSLATRLTQFDPNIVFTLPASVAVANQVGLVETTNFGILAAAPPLLLGTPLILPQTGIMLTTGNTTGTGQSLGPLAGDIDVFNALSAHPLFGTAGTSDAASLSFSFTVPANTPSVSFDLIYATNEALAGAVLPDAVVVMIDGINRGTFSNGQLLANLNGAFLNATNGTLISGYTNLSQAQTLTALLNPLLATHTLKISIADNTLPLTDSALIIANMRTSTSTINGMGPLGADFLPPTITPAANIVIEATGLATAVNLGAPTVTDNVDINPTATPAPVGPYPVGVTLVTWTSTDVAGNIGTAIQTVTITDTTAPVLVAPIAQTFSTVSPTLAADIAVHLLTVTATDAVGVILPITNDAPLAGFPVGNTTVTFTVLDAAGNVGTATTVITVNSANIINVTNATSLATRLTQFDPNVVFTLPVSTAVINQTGLVETTSFGILGLAPLTLPQTGIILTTGNTTGTGNNLGPLAGDADVFGALSAHPLFATAGTSDAASLSFSFTVPVNTPSVSFDLIYATNEALAGIAFPDAVVVMVDGVNRATFTNGDLLSNLNGGFLNASNGTLISGYTNLSQAQVLTTLLNPALATHTIKISIADNSTSLVDSALIISNMRVSASTQNGIGVLGADFLPPVITPTGNIVIEATGLLTVVNLGVPNVVDNVDPNPVVTFAPVGPYPVGVTLVTWTSTDLAGNVGTAIQTVTVTDATAPLVVAPAAQTFSTISPTMAVDIATHLATVTATDVVGVILPIINDAPLAGFPVGNTTVTFTVLDAAGNIGTATTVITVSAASILNITNAVSLATRLTQFDPNIAFTLPVSVAIANQTGLVETTNFGALGLAPLVLNQRGIILTTGNTTGTGNNLGPLAGDIDVFNALNNHPLFATAGTSDAASLQFSFTVPANTPSVSFDLIYATNEALAGTALPDAVVVMVDGVNRGTFTNGDLLANLNGAFLNATNGTLISGYTNLSQAQTLTTLLNPLLATHTIKISIADNTVPLTDSALIISNMRTSTSTINGMGPLGIDFLPPVITPAANVVVEAVGLTTVANLGAPTVVDDVDPNPVVTFAPAGPYPIGVTVVTWTATDVAGNVGIATQTVTVTDTIAPAITAPAAQIFSTASATLAADIAAHLATVAAFDAVGVILPITNDAPLAGFPIGNTTVTFTVADAAANIATATTVITVSSASILNVSNATSLATRLTQFDPNITFTLPVSTAAVNQVGLVETTNFGTLAAVPPLVAGAALTLPQRGIILTTGNTSGAGNNLGPLAGDANVFSALSAHPLFATTGTSDAASLQFSFTVPANTPSVAFDLIYATNEALAGVPFPDAVTITIDGVNRATFTNGLLLSNLNGAFLSATNGTLIPGYTNLSSAQTLTALLNPLLATHTIKISIADNSTSLTDSAVILSHMRISTGTVNGMGTQGLDFLPPAITPAVNVVIEATGLTTVVNLGVPNVVDNVDPNPTVTSAPVGPYPVGVTIVTWTATDVAGNIGTATQTVTVTDTIAPAVAAPAAQTFSTVSPTMAADIAAYLATVTATDVVGVILPITNDAPIGGFPVGNTTVTFTVSDAAGNVGTATTVITVSAASIVNITNATSLATRLTQFDPNITFTLPASTAVANQAGLVETTNFGTLGLLPLTLPQTGIILTTGNVTGTGNNLGPLAGDADVFNALSAHPLFTTIGTSDAASLQFSFTVPVNTPSVAFDLIFATNEALAGVTFPDAVTITVDGVNRATFTNGLLLANLNGAFLAATNGTLISGYTNLSQAQVLTALLNPALATHTIKITIADNGTPLIDSALILSNMRISASTQNGIGVLGADFQPPVITLAANVVVEATGPTTVVNLAVLNITDNVDPNPVLTVAPPGPFPVGVTLVTWTATDASGNIGTATQTVTVVDTTAPAIAAPAAQVFSSASPTMAADIAAHLAAVTAIDAVGAILPITNDAPLAGFPVGNTTVTFSVADVAGNIGTATTVITVTSASIINITNATSLATRLTQFDPNITFTLPASTAIANQVGLIETTNFGTLAAVPPLLAGTPLTLAQPGIILTTGNVTGTGNNLGPLAGDLDVFNALSAHPAFTTIGTSDAATLQFSFTVPLNTPSVAFDLIYATNEALAGVTFPDAVTITVDGVNRATFTNGLLLANLNGAFLNATNGTLLSGYTNLSQTQVLTTLLNPLLATHTIKITIADNGTSQIDSALILSNMRVSTSTQNGIGVLGADFQPPVLTVAANVTVEATGPTTAVNLGILNVTDNLDPNPVLTVAPPGPFPVGITLVTWTATDASGNIATATQTVNVVDTTAPAIAAPAAQVFSSASPTMAADIAAHLATVIATDAVAVVFPITNDAPLAGFPVGNTIVTFSVADAAGNIGTGITVITVNSASIINVTNATSLATRLTQFDPNITFTLPFITAIANQVGLVETTNFGTLAAVPPLLVGTPVILAQPGIILTTGNVTGTGNNLGPLAGDLDVFNALSAHPSFTTIGTSDAASLQFSFTVPFNTPSVDFDLIFATNEALAGVTFPDAVTITVDGVNRATFTNGLLLANLNGAFLNATNSTLIPGYTNLSQTQVLTALLDPLLATHTIKITIADNGTSQIDSALILSNMRVSTSTQNGIGVLGADFQPPVLTVAANVTVEATGPTTAVNLGILNVTDNLDPNPVLTVAPPGPFPVGITLVTWTATDASGNIGSATQTVTVVDTTAPAIAAPAAQVFSSASPTIAADIAAHLATVVAVDLVAVVLPITNDAPLAGFPVGNTTVTFSVADAAGNIGTGTTVITVNSASIININNATSLATRLTQFDPNITFTLPFITAIANQVGLVETTNFGTLAAVPPLLVGTPVTLAQPGIILTTGNVTGTGNNLAQLGDADVFNALSAHPSFTTIGTSDAASLQFSFTVPLNTPSVDFDLIFATNEALAGVTFPDAVTITVDGVNRATFPNGLLLANLNGAFLNATNGTLIAGYSNLSQTQVFTALLDPLLATHTIKITIADNGTSLIDSALILSNMRVSTSTQNGIGALGADFQPPVITVPTNIVVEATGPTTVVNLGLQNVTDNLDPNPVLVAAPVGPYPVGVTLVTWTATDAAGNIGTATQTVTITDTTAPAIVAPISQVFSTASPTFALDIAAHLATVVATDVVGVVLPITNDAPLAGFPVGNTIVTFSVADAIGNIGTATTVITVTSASIINSIDANALATRLTQFDGNINFTLPALTAVANQTGLVETTNFGTLAAVPLVLAQRGIMLSTGNVTGTGNNLGPLAGDADVFNALNAHPLFATTGTSDAASLQFSFTVPANIPSVSFDLIYATNEALAGALFPDAVVIMVDGVNLGTFSNGLLLSNLNGAFLNASNGILVSGFTNLSQGQTLTTLLNPLLTTHTIKISIADNGTSLTDSALIISNMRTSLSTQNGMGVLGADNFPPSLTVAADVVTEATGLLTGVNLGTPNVVDNLDPNPTVIPVPAGPYPVGLTVVTWTATDAAGNVSTAIQNVTVTDTIAPLVTAPAAQTFSTASPTMAIDVAAHLATVIAADLVGVVLPVINNAPIAGFPVGNTVVTFTALDVAGNIGTASTVITVTSATIFSNPNATSLAARLTQFDPNINVAFPSAVAVANQVGLVETTNFGVLPQLAPALPIALALPRPSIMLTTGNLTGTGNNLGLLASADVDVFNALSAHPLYNTTGTSDAATLQFSFAVPANTVSVDFDLIYATNEVLAPVAFADAAVVMVDGVNRGLFTNGQLLSNLNGTFLNATNGTLIPGYSNVTQPLTLTALLDPVLATHTVKITIADNSTPFTDSALIISNMRISVGTQNGMGPLGTDFIPPTVIAPADVVIEAAGPLTTINLGVPTVTDNIDPNLAVLPVPAGPYPVGVTLVTWTATDTAGNVGTAVQNVTVNDTLAPAIIAPAIRTFSTFSPTLVADIAAHLATVSATDLVSGVLAVTNDAPLLGFPAGNTTVTFTAVDAVGNIGTATTFITLSAAPIINSTNAFALATRLTQFDPTITVLTPVLTATVDQAGLVEDSNFGTLNQVAPALPVVLSLPQPAIILTTGNLTGTGNNLAPPTALAGDQDVFNALSAHPTFLSAGTSDAATLSFTFTVPVNTPSVTLDFIYATNEALAGVQFPDAAVIMIDGVNQAIFSNGLLLANFNGNFLQASTGALIPGYINVSLAHTLTAVLDPTLLTHTIKISIADNTDANVDSALILSNMHVTTSTQGGMGSGDFLPPVVIAPADVTAEATGITSFVNLGVGFATDNVDINPTVVPSLVGSFPLGLSQVTWTSTDLVGNVGTAIQTVNVVDTTPPVLTTPANVSFAATAQSGLSSASVSMATLLVTAAATDAVGVRSITNNAPPQFPIGVTRVTFIATDISGNISTGFTDIVITAFVAGGGGVGVANGIDQISPVLTLVGSRNVTVLQTAAVIPAATYADPGATVYDNFDGPTPGVIAATTSIDTSIAGTTVLIYSATDSSGNNAQIIRTVHVVTPIAGVDLLPPTVTLQGLPGNLTGGHDIFVPALSFEGVPKADPSLVAFFSFQQITAVDNPGGSGLAGAITNDAPIMIPVGKTVVTFTATDLAGNTGTAQATITVSGLVQNTGSFIDIEPDLMPDAWEIRFFGDLITAGPGTDFDADGLTDALERLLGTNPLLPNSNPSGASTDLKDIGNLSNPIDSDGDGIIDALEDNASMLDASVVTGIPSTNGSTTFSIRGNGNAIQAVAVTPTGAAPFNLLAGHGLLSYKVLTTIGGTATIQINSSQPFGTNAQFYKVDAIGNYSVIPATNVVMVGANTIDLTLTDGGPFDLDGVANGVIVDPIAFGAPPAVLGANSGVGGGVGCAMRPNAAFDPLLPFMFIMAVAFLAIRQRSRY